MACGQSDFVSGTYQGYIWDPLTGSVPPDAINWLSIGVTDDGFEIEMETSIQEITVDQYADSMVDGIYRGGNCYINATLAQFGAQGARMLRQAYVDSKNISTVDDHISGEGQLGTIGCSIRNYAFPLVLRRVAPIAADNSADRYIFPVCIVDPNLPIRWTLQSRLWTLPVRLRVLPFHNDGATQDPMNYPLGPLSVIDGVSAIATPNARFYFPFWSTDAA